MTVLTPLFSGSPRNTLCICKLCIKQSDVIFDRFLPLLFYVIYSASSWPHLRYFGPSIADPSLWPGRNRKAFALRGVVDGVSTASKGRFTLAALCAVAGNREGPPLASRPLSLDDTGAVEEPPSWLVDGCVVNASFWYHVPSMDHKNHRTYHHWCARHVAYSELNSSACLATC